MLNRTIYSKCLYTGFGFILASLGLAQVPDLVETPNLLQYADSLEAPDLLQVPDFPAIPNEEFYKTRPIEYVTTTWSSGQIRHVVFGPAPPDWISLDDVRLACSLIFDPTPCLSPHNTLSSVAGPPTSIGFEARRVIEGYGDLYPPMTQTAKSADVLIKQLRKKLESDHSLDKSAKQDLVKEFEEIISEAKSKHTNRLLISIGSEWDRSKPLTGDELIVNWLRDAFLVNDIPITLEEMIKVINEQEKHHLLIKIPSGSDVSLSRIREVFSSIRGSVNHVAIVETRFVQMLSPNTSSVP